MIPWLSLTPVALVSVAVMLLPGLAIGAALRFRGILLWGFAPAAGVATISVAATALGLIGVRWSVWTAAIAVIVLIALVLVVGRIIGRTPFSGRAVRPGWASYAAIGVGALLGAIRMAVMIGTPGALSQTNDATFHLNALRFVQETGQASSLDLLGTVEGSGFYPAAWHAVASLVIEMTGIDLISAANGTALAIAGPIWALSITAFVWCATGGRRLATVFAAIMAPALVAFPFHMLDYGVLYPFALSVAVLPGVLAVAAALFDRGSVGRLPAPRRIWTAGIATLIGLAALALAQPSALLNWLIGAAVIVLSVLVRGWELADRTGRARRAVGMGIVLVVTLVMWFALVRVSSSVLWQPLKPAVHAAVDLLLNRSIGPGPAIVMSILAIVGVVFAWRRVELRWLVIYGAAISLLVLVAISVQSPSLRSLLMPWYADPARFIAMMPLVVIPLAAVGADGLVKRVRSRSVVASKAVAVVLVALVVTETLVWTAVGGQTKYYEDSATPYLSHDERNILERLPEYVEPGSRILGNPSTGAAFGFALSGEDVVPRTWSMPGDPDFQLLRSDLVGLADDPRVCPAVERLGIDYVLDFGESDKGAGKWDMPGLTGFAYAAGFEKLAQEGDASLWRITGCD